MEQPNNAEIMRELMGVKRQMDRLVRNLPVLVRLAGDTELRQREAEKNLKRKEAAGRIAAGN